MKNFDKKFGILHFIGIGGIGMSGIAEVLINLGYKVTGSDLIENQNVSRLKKLGINIFIGHKKENIEDAAMVVISSAINQDNEEILEAKKKKITYCEKSRNASRVNEV